MTRVQLGDGSWVDMENPPPRYKRIIGFILIASLTQWHITVAALVVSVTILIYLN